MAGEWKFEDSPFGGRHFNGHKGQRKLRKVRSRAQAVLQKASRKANRTKVWGN